mmetsp:Transcript_32541/g.66280  ORF Transcript_32541/g.66280 Transcript_32541/m.66280 type:complete len:2909 (-) Transcript_32541:130-8856(-)
MITAFRRQRGFRHLANYLSKRASSSSMESFPSLDLIREVLSALETVAMFPLGSGGNEEEDGGTANSNQQGQGQQQHLQLQSQKINAIHDECRAIASAVTKHIIEMDDQTLKKFSTDAIYKIRQSLGTTYQRIADSKTNNNHSAYPMAIHEHHEFWRELALKLITSQSLPLRLFGWEQVGKLIEDCEVHQPPPRSYIVSGAGTAWVNGRYEFDPRRVLENGYVNPAGDVQYVHHVPVDVDNPEQQQQQGGVAGKTLTLFRCTMRSQQKWWFLSEADADQPGTDKDIDYYQHKSKKWQEKKPPDFGWLTCRSGEDPPPTLKSLSVMVPPGEEYNTLEHKLAKWAIENGVIELVLGDSIHREIVSRSTELIKFLAGMCNVDDPIEPVVRDGVASPMQTDMIPNQYCLRASHLLMAWKTCINTRDDAVSTQIYQLLVSILPSLSDELAIPLIKAIHESLVQSLDKGEDHFLKVSQFCSTVAEKFWDPEGKTIPVDESFESMDNKTRNEILSLLWAVLTHKDALTLKTYMNIERFTFAEIGRQQDEVAETMREKFLAQCKDFLGNQNEELVDEAHALHMCQLTKSVLEGYDRADMETYAQGSGGFAEMLYEELVAYLKRRSKTPSAPPLRKPSTMSMIPEFNHTNALTERLQILRLVYGIQVNTQLRSDQLDLLWSMCVLPADKELFMTFLANASAEDPGPQLRPENAMYNVDRLNPAFESNTRNDVFQKIFCSEYVGWENLGEPAYQSFQKFEDHGMRQSDAALDALWRICLTSGNNNVASQAMSDLLSVYSSSTPTSQESVSMNGKDHRFSNRIFKCLVEVKEGLQRGDNSSERSAERCISILNAAIEKCNSLGGSAGAVAERLTSLQEGSSLDSYLTQVPHGMRGVSSCKRIQVLAKVISRNSPTQANPNESTSQNATVPNTPQRFPLEIHPLQTVGAIKAQIGLRCNHIGNSIRITTGLGGRSRGMNNPNTNSMPDSTLAADLGLVEGSEIVAILSDKPAQQQSVDNLGSDIGPDILDQEQPSKSSHLDLSDLFSGDGSNGSSEFFSTLMVVLESLPVLDANVKDGPIQGKKAADTHSLVWDLLLAMPTNAGIIEKVHRAASGTDPAGDAMLVESLGGNSDWSSLVDFGHFERSVYVMQILDSLLRPATAMFSGLNPNTAAFLSKAMEDHSASFRINFTKSGGFAAVMRLFVESGNSDKLTRRRNRMGNACALRILKECFFNNDELSVEGQELIETFADTSGFLKSLVCTVIDDDGITYNALFRVLSLVRMMLESGPIFIRSFASLPGNLAETFLTSLLLWESAGSIGATGIQSTVKVRKTTEDMILAIPLLSSFALPWLVKALKNIDTNTDGSDEFFSVLLKLVSSVDPVGNEAQLKDLGASVCFKLASYPGRTSDTACTFNSTGVLCGCLKLLISLIEAGGNNFLVEGSPHILNTINVSPWSDEGAKLMEDKPLIDLMGAIFDGFISSSKSGASPVCCDVDSRRLAFNAVASAAKACGGGRGYTILAKKINVIIANVAPSLRHKWGQKPVVDGSNNSRNTANYSGLKNQGCTCYMNSFLQQLFMMPDLRENLCSAELPSSLRSTGGGALAKGDALIGKKISLHWDSGQNFEAMVEGYNADTDMHTISYLPIVPGQQVGQHNQVPQPDFHSLPRELPDEFILSEGRPGKETGAFEICPSSNMARTSVAGESSLEGPDAGPTEELKESEDEASSRKLLEEVQRTFVNLDEARGRCYDPRALVEASHCLKLEFDVWQQNDAAEFATKLLDRLEISLKKWSPSHFKYLTHKFGLKTTKQKICKECGLKSNREGDLISIDCQVRNKSNIHEGISAMCEEELMDGENKVGCDKCNKKTNTVLRTAVSQLSDVLVLSLKRFDLDYTTFETVKINSRYEFEETLNMKQYTLEAKELLEAAHPQERKSETGSMMDLGESDAGNEEDSDPLAALPDEDYEYRLAGVLVHAGVAQGGHYYSFVKDRTSGKWYRFDDEDVTPFDPKLIEQECFGGKMKKETKYPNGHVHTVESEQFANALLVFYEKVKPSEFDDSDTEVKESASDTAMEEEPKSIAPKPKASNGYEVFLPEVKKSNSTHSWQSFLLTDEFQAFVKELLEVCTNPTQSSEDSMDITPNSSPSPVIPITEIESWRLNIINTSFSFVFDVLFHLALDSNVRRIWTEKMIQLLSSSPAFSAAFVADLAKRTHTVYENWIRAYTVECSEEASSYAALRIFSCAIASTVSQPSEQLLLSNWTQSWASQVADRERLLKKREHIGAMPTRLETARQLEDVANIGGTATGVGIILSFITELVELSPRMNLKNVNVCFFIRELASLQSRVEANLLRDAMNAAQLLLRLFCLALREKTPYDYLKQFFPGSSLPMETARMMSKPETNTSNLLQMQHSGMNGNEYQSEKDQLLLEAIGCLFGLPWVKQEPLTFETGSVQRGRVTVALTPVAVQALTSIFEESKPSESNGMSKNDVQFYMSRFHHRLNMQKIDNIFERYGVQQPDGNQLLYLDGFLEFYRTAAQANELEVREHFHVLGYRPNLTRLSDEARFYSDESGEKHHNYPIEAIAIEVARYRSALPLLETTELLFNLNFAHHIIHSSPNPVAYTLLVAFAFGRDTRRIIHDALKLYQDNRQHWDNDWSQMCTTVFMILAAIPDEWQKDRINMLLTSDHNSALGLLRAGNTCHNTREHHHYAEKILELMKTLKKFRGVSNWMAENRVFQEWMQPQQRRMNPLQSRNDHSGRRDGHHNMHVNAHGHSDSEGVNESDIDSDDDDSAFDENLVKEMTVEGAGLREINGTYARIGQNDNVSKFMRTSRYNGRSVDFMLFRCKLTDGTRRWYISIVPENAHPGTTQDIDFYAVGPSQQHSVLDPNIPPRDGWMAIPSNGGGGPAPQVYPKESNVVGDDNEMGYL